MGGFSGGRRRAFRNRHHTPMGEGGRLAVIFVSLALVLFVITVMLGNHLRKLAESGAVVSDGDTTEAEIYYANAPDALIARGIVFGVNYSDAADITESEATDETGAESLVKDDIEYDAVSVTLRQKLSDDRMALAYSSPISLEYSIDQVGAVPLDDGISLIAENWGSRTTLCGVFEIDYPNRPEETREIMRAYEISLVCELVEAGIDEILLVGFAADTGAGVSFISDVYERVGRKTVIGLALPFDYVNLAGRAGLLELSKKCAFLAVDLYTPAVPVLMTAESLIADRVARVADMRREFDLRILLGCGNDPDTDSQTRAALELGAKNTMVGLGLPDIKMNAEKTTEVTE